MFENGHPQIVHGPLSHTNRGTDLSHGERPSQEQVGQVEAPDDEDSPHRPFRFRIPSQLPVNAQLDQLGTGQPRSRGDERQGDIEQVSPPIRAGIAAQSAQDTPPHLGLRKLLVQRDVVVGGHDQRVAVGSS